jgi:heme exporter protein B
MSGMLAVIRRDLLIAARRKSEVLTALFFFIIVTSLFPLGIGPEPTLLKKIAPGILWVIILCFLLDLANGLK